MTARETRFIKALLDSGALSFKTAAELEAERQVASGSGAERFVWDLAVERGLVTAELSRQTLAQVDSSPQAPVGAKGGQTELGGFELLTRLGQGGMGAVYKARQKSMDRLVALKILPKNMARNLDFISRFLREARAAGKLRHPNIVLGIDAGFADGYYYFAMEYVEGRNLGDRVRSDGPLPEKEVLDIGRQVAEALDYAHRAGLVHRDVKPENILVAPGGQAKLCDLGLARASGADDDDMRVTQAGAAVGTPYYISPEQVRGEDPDCRGDVYSLGCTLYHLVAGHAPFVGPSPLATMQKHLTDTAERLSVARPGTSRALEAVIETMMARSAAERYQTAGEVAEDLAKIAGGGVPAALTAALAGRRKGGGPATTRKGQGGSTAATSPIGARAVRTAFEPPVGPGWEATADTRALAAVGRLAGWRLLAAVAGVVVVMGAGSFLLAKVLRDRGKGPTTTTVTVEDNVPRPPPEDPLKALREKLKAAQAYASDHPKNYAEILLLYGKLAREGAGSEIETAARQAMAEAQQRQEADLAVERLRLLGAEFEKARAFEAANPGKLPEIVERYLKISTGAGGTEFEAKAKAAAEAATRRHGARARELLAALAKQVDRDSSAGSFGAALGAIDGFAKDYAPAVEPDLAKLREGALAAGRARWGQLLDEGRRLSGAGRFADAAAALARGKTLGLPGLDAEITAALAEVDKARLAAEQARFAAAEKAYKKFGEDLPKLFAEKQYAEARRRGEKLMGTLTAESEARLRAELVLISGGEAFLKELRAGLGRLKADQVKLNSPMGEGFLQSFDPATDKLAVKVSVGNSSVISDVEVAGVEAADLVRLATKAAGGELAAKTARNAACLLLTSGKTAGVKELLELARKGGEPVDDLAKRLAAAEAAPPAPAPAPAPGPAPVDP